MAIKMRWNGKSQTMSIAVALNAAVLAFYSGPALAYDTYYWVDSGDNDMAAAANWRLNSATGEVPATFPPTLDIATGGSTHPLLRIPAGSTLSLPNSNSLTVNWIGVEDAKADCTIDLGSASKTLTLFGGGDASFWIGKNYPNGQKVTLKSGTIQRYAGTTRRNNVRLGGAPASRGALATFIADGTDARLDDMAAVLDSGNVVFCLTNGATMRSSQSNAVAIGTGVSNAVFRVAGSGTLFAMTDKSKRGVMMGDADVANPPVRSGGTIEVIDGGVVSNIYGAVGNKSGYHSVLVDNGKWYACNTLSIGANANAHNNRMVVRNKSRYVYAEGISSCNVTVGSSGCGNSLYVEDSEFRASSLYVGYMPGANGNSAVFSNATLSSSMTVYVGGKCTDATAFAATNNSVALIDCEVGSADAGAVQIVVGSGMYASSNRLDLVRTQWYPSGTYFGVAGESPSGSTTPTNQSFNSMRVVDGSFVSYRGGNYFYLGRNGDSNALEIANSSTVDLDCLSIGGSVKNQARPTVGNYVFVGDGSLLDLHQYLFFYPERAKLTISNGTFRARNVINWHYYYSKTQGKTVDNLNDAEADGVTFDTEIKFMGSNPRFEFTNSGRDLGFDAGERLSFVLPELPYAEATIYGARNVNFTNVAGYSFDLSGVGVQGGKYVLAEAAGTLTVRSDELERMNAALPSTRKAKIYVSGKQLILRVGSTLGLSVIVR